MGCCRNARSGRCACAHASSNARASAGRPEPSADAGASAAESPPVRSWRSAAREPCDSASGVPSCVHLSQITPPASGSKPAGPCGTSEPQRAQAASSGAKPAASSASSSSARRRALVAAPTSRRVRNSSSSANSPSAGCPARVRSWISSAAYPACAMRWRCSRKRACPSRARAHLSGDLRALGAALRKLPEPGDPVGARQHLEDSHWRESSITGASGRAELLEEPRTLRGDRLVPLLLGDRASLEFGARLLGPLLPRQHLAEEQVRVPDVRAFLGVPAERPARLVQPALFRIDGPELPPSQTVLRRR